MFKNGTPRQIAYYVIAIGFLIYGGLRVAGALPAFAQSMGWWDTQIGRQIVEVLESSLPEMSGQAIVSLPVQAYIAWSAIMGIVLTVSSLLALFMFRADYVLMGAYFFLFGLGFINYMVVNVKLVHFAAGLLLFLLMLWLSDVRPRRMQPSRTER